MKKNDQYIHLDLCVDFDCSKTISCIEILWMHHRNNYSMEKT
jgi:hypothetical protein